MVSNVIIMYSRLIIVCDVCLFVVFILFCVLVEMDEVNLEFIWLYYGCDVEVDVDSLNYVFG